MEERAIFFDEKEAEDSSDTPVMFSHCRPVSPEYEVSCLVAPKQEADPQTAPMSVTVPLQGQTPHVYGPPRRYDLLGFKNIRWPQAFFEDYYQPAICGLPPD